MKEILKVGLPGFSAEYNVEWFEDTDFSNVENIKQVYGILFNNEGKVFNNQYCWELAVAWRETRKRRIMGGNRN